MASDFTIFSNLAIITHSNTEFVLDFIRVMPGVPKARVKSRIILTPEHAKRLLAAMQDNIEKYEAFKYDPKEGFVKTEMWDAEFFKHKKSGRFIDLRYLQQITELNIFLSFVSWLEDESNG